MKILPVSSMTSGWEISVFSEDNPRENLYPGLESSLYFGVGTPGWKRDDLCQQQQQKQ